MGAVHTGTERASFELARLELHDGRLLVGGWWFGVRGMRFVRPALVVEGRKILATLEHKPWAAGADGSWTAAFPWKDEAPPDLVGVMLVVAPSVEVPLDREAATEPEPDDAAVVAVDPPSPRAAAGDGRQPLRDELQALESRLDAARDELHEARAIAAEREARCRELEQVAARERRAAAEAEVGSDAFVRSHAIAVLDRDRAARQLDEAVADREAALRARARMEAQREEAVSQLQAVRERCEEVIAERDEARRQRDETLLAHRALQQQLKGEWASAERSQRTTRRLAPADAPRAVADGAAVPAPPPPLRAGASHDQPSGVRVIPAARTVAAHLHRAQREGDSGVTRLDMWAIRILGGVAALAFISLLVMILKAFFVF